MKDFDLEERVSRAVQNFEAGYNCAQSVFLAYSDVLNWIWRQPRECLSLLEEV